MAAKACFVAVCIYGSHGVYRELSTNDQVLSNISSSLNEIKASVDGLKTEMASIARDQEQDHKDVAAIKAGNR
jgi:hypothetical protein